jgi:hypothetical protein
MDTRVDHSSKFQNLLTLKFFSLRVCLSLEMKAVASKRNLTHRFHCTLNVQTWLLLSLVLHLLQRIGSTHYLRTVTCVTYLAADRTAV